MCVCVCVGGVLIRRPGADDDMSHKRKRKPSAKKVENEAAEAGMCQRSPSCGMCRCLACVYLFVCVYERESVRVSVDAMCTCVLVMV